MSWLTQAAKAVGGVAKKVGTVAGALRNVPVVGTALAPLLDPVRLGAQAVGGLVSRGQKIGAAVATAVGPISGRPPPILAAVQTLAPARPLSLPLSAAPGVVMSSLYKDPAWGGLTEGERSALWNRLGREPSYAEMQAAAGSNGSGSLPGIPSNLPTRVFDRVVNLFGSGGAFPAIAPPVLPGPSTPAVGGGLEWYRGKLYARSAKGRRIHVTFNRMGQIVPAPKRMNVLNPRALSRANRRTTGFARAARGTLRQLGFTVSATRRAKGVTARRKRR